MGKVEFWVIKGKGNMADKKIKNRYASHSKISDASFRMVAKMFASDLAAVEIARQTGLNRNTVNRYTLALRKRIMERYGEIQLGGCTDDVFLIFGICANDGKVTVEPIETCCGVDIRRMIAGRGTGDQDDFARWRKYDGIISIERSMRLYLNFGKIMRTSQSNSLMVTEDFFSFVKERMNKFFGISKKHFFVHLKECEFRYNYQTEDLYSLILKMTKETPLFRETCLN